MISYMLCQPRFVGQGSVKQTRLTSSLNERTIERLVSFDYAPADGYDVDIISALKHRLYIGCCLGFPLVFNLCRPSFMA